MSAELRSHVLKGFLEFYHAREHSFKAYKQWEWVKKGASLNAQIRVGSSKGTNVLEPIHFTVFGMVDRLEGMIVLKRPEWGEVRVIERRITLEYDKQLLTLAQAVKQHGWDAVDVADEIKLACGKEPPTGALLFATVLFDIRQQDHRARVPYVLSVVEFEGMYRGVKADVYGEGEADED